MEERKYFVVKTRDFEDMLAQIAHAGLSPTIGGILNELAEKELDDAVVIRRQDQFAPPALDAYANSILVALSLVAHNDQHAQERAKSLKEIADYFHHQASLAWDTARKLPD